MSPKPAGGQTPRKVNSDERWLLDHGFRSGATPDESIESARRRHEVEESETLTAEKVPRPPTR